MIVAMKGWRGAYLASPVLLSQLPHVNPTWLRAAAKGRVALQSNRLPDEVFDGAAQGVCERQYRGNRGAAQVELVLLVELYGAKFNPR